jgi:anthranilate phosphoribosyltransferase
LVETTLGKLAAGQNLAMDEMSAAMDAVMAGAVPEGQIALLLTLLHQKGETVEEIAGAAASLRRHMTPIETTRSGVIDTCGTGGDASGTFNISTAAALVTAAAGVPVAKHGNRRITSRTGSADVLLALGVNIEADVNCVGRCLDELGICFCFAPLLHGSMKQVAHVRRELGFPTIFNLLGPLTNPARASYQLLGVGKPHLRPLLANALLLLGAERAIVVAGEDGLDEVTLTGPTQASEAAAGHLREFTWTPADFGIAQQANLSTLQVDGPEQSAALILAILDGQLGPPRDIVLLNTAAALWTARHAPDPLSAARLAAEAIDSGAAKHLLERLVQSTRA